MNSFVRVLYLLDNKLNYQCTRPVHHTVRNCIRHCFETIIVPYDLKYAIPRLPSLLTR